MKGLKLSINTFNNIISEAETKPSLPPDASAVPCVPGDWAPLLTQYDYEIVEGQAAHQQVKCSAAEDLSFISPPILCQFHVIFIPENDLRALLVPCYCGHLTSDVTSVEYHHFNKVEELHIPSLG